MNSISRSLSYAWRPVLLVLTLAALSYLLYFHRLDSLLPGYAPAEAAAYHSAASWHTIVNNPVNAPYKLLVWGIAMAGQHQLLATRIAAAIWGLAAVIVFFCITRAWYGFRTAFFGTVLFATSAGFLHLARLGTPQILQMGVLMLIGAVIWHRRSARWHPYLTYLIVLTFGMLLYVPGMAWLELIVAAAIFPGIRRHWLRSGAVHRIIWVAGGLLLTTPLLLATVRQPHLALQVLGLPTDVHSLTGAPQRLIETVLALGVRSSGSALQWVGHSPLLDALELILGALGVYYYAYHDRSRRSLLLAGAIIGTVLIALQGGVGFASIVPLAYLLITGGLDHFLREWLTVFPRNPIARGVGLGVICIMLFFSVLYQTRSYFVAWPHNTRTRQAFRLPPS